MTWVPSEKEMADVLAADGRHRYEYFIHRVCEAKAVWALYNEGWASVGQDTGEPMIPFWPHRVFAVAFATGAWAGFEPRKIELDDFLDTWIAGMRKQGVQPAVFPVPEGTSIIVSLEDLDEALRHELDEVYGVDE
jgi:hypothetical protein